MSQPSLARPTTRAYVRSMTAFVQLVEMSTSRYDDPRTSEYAAGMAHSATDRRPSATSTSWWTRAST